LIFARFLILFFLVEMNWRSIGTHGAKKHSLKHVDETSQFSYQVFIIFAIRSFVSCYYFYYYHHDLQKLGANYYLVCNQFFFGYLVMTFFFLCFLFEVGYSTCHWWVCDIFLSFSSPKCLSKTWMNNWLIVWCLSFDGCRCHVMKVESFEDEEVAELLNDSFVSVKVCSNLDCLH
jgi:hypothetical protein